MPPPLDEWKQWYLRGSLENLKILTPPPLRKSFVHAPLINYVTTDSMMSSSLWALACLDFSTFCLICLKHIGFVWRSITLIISKVTQQVRIPQWENWTVFLNLLHKGVTLVFTNVSISYVHCKDPLHPCGRVK